MHIGLVLLGTLIQISAGFPVSGLALQYPPGKTYRYTYTTETTVNEPTSKRQTRAQEDVGIKISATVELTPVWHNKEDFLVKLAFTKPKIYSASRPEHTRDLRGLPKLPVYFEWNSGKVQRVFVSEDDPTTSVNIKKGVISLFQLKDKDGERSEEDSSGKCNVLYRVEDGKLRKTKSDCQSLDTTGHTSNVNPILAVSVSRISEAVYKMKDDVIQTVSVTEVTTSTVNLQETLATSVASRQELKLEGSGQGSAISAGSIQEVIQKISKDDQLKLYETPLSTLFEPERCTKNCDAEEESLVEKHRDQLKSSSMATTETAHAYLEILEAFRNTNKNSLLRILKDEANVEIVPALIDLIAGAQTSASLEAIMEYLNFDDEYEIELPERYLLAVAFSTKPTPQLLKNLLALYQKKVVNENLQESIGESLGAVLNTYCRMGHCDTDIAKEIQRSILARLEACEDEKCKCMNIRALCNAGISDTIPILLKYAETAKEAGVSEAAVKALRRMDKTHMTSEVLNALRRIFLQKNRGFDSAVRTTALKYLLEAKPNLEELREIFMQTTDPYNTEFDVYVQARLFDLMKHDDEIRKMIEEILKDDSIRNYNILAPNGKSLSFTSNMAETNSVTATYVMYVENSRAGVMKRSGMDVVAVSPYQTLPIYNFGLYAAGIEGLLAKEVEPGDEDLEATAGLSLDLIDVSLRPISFFTGQGGLMSAVWNAPSEPISALQGNILMQDHYERLHLQNGLIVELQVRGALSMDMSGSMSISLWNKNSKSLIKNSGALVMHGSTSIKTTSFKTGLDFKAESGSVIDFQTDVDFYDGIKMCLQMGRPDFTYRHNVTKYESAEGFKKSFTARINRSLYIPGVSYPLPPPNNAQCRVLLAEA